MTFDSIEKKSQEDISLLNDRKTKESPIRINTQ